MGGATVITLNKTREPEGMAASVGIGTKAGLGHVSEPSLLSIPKVRVWGLRLFHLTLPISLRWGFGCGNCTQKPMRLDRVMGKCAGATHVEDSGPYLLLPRALSLLLRAPPRIPVLLRPRDRPHNPFQPGPISPKAFYQFCKLYRSAYRGQRWENMPAPNQCAHAASSAKQSSRMHLKQGARGRVGAGGGQSVCPEGNPSVLRNQPFSQRPQPRITELECVSLRGRCYGDFINNIIFRIPVPSTRRKGRQAGNAERGGENNDLAPPPPAREEGAHLPFPLIGRKLWSPERSCRLPRPRPRKLAKPGREKQTRAPMHFDGGLKGTSGGFCRGGKGAAAAARKGLWEQRWGQELPPSARSRLCTRLARTLRTCHLTTSLPSTPAACPCPGTGPT